MLPLRLFLFATIASLATAQKEKNPIVRIGQGLLQGTWKTSTRGRIYGSFEGLPYARPPVGKYRFREPETLKSWAGVWDASRTFQPCLQYIRETIVGSEDCLYINVYSPNLDVQANLPVVVNIHGGAFMNSAIENFNPELLMDRDVVVVTFFYRVGPLGFLSTGDEVVPGNAGLKDQSMALLWIRDNIVMFGGNPDNVTLMGCSAGAVSVHYHYLSPRSRGLFARGYALSGSTFAPWALQLKPAEKAKALAAVVGCPTTIHKDMVECMRYRNGDMIVGAQVDLMQWRVHLFTPFTPTVEAPQVKDPFLTKYPYCAAQDGSVYNAPLIVSIDSEEGLYPAAAYQRDPKLLEELEANWEQLSSYIFEYNDTLPLERRREVAIKIKDKYLAGKPVGQETFSQLVQALGDRLFAVAAGKLAQVQAMNSRQPVYVYRYTFRGNYSLSNFMAMNNINYGTSHADDFLHITRSKQDIANDSEDDRLMTEALLDLIYSYASTGTPKLNNGRPWLPVVPGSPDINYLEISSPINMEMKTSSDFGLRSFWDSLGFIENENYPDCVRDISP